MSQVKPCSQTSPLILLSLATHAVMTSSLEHPKPEPKHLEITCSRQFPAWLALHNGDIQHWVRLEGGINELYDVQVLPQVRSATVARQQRQVFTADSESGHLRHWYAAPAQP